VQFRTPPHLMFGGAAQQAMQPNTLIMRVQPNEGVSLSFEAKVPGAAAALTSDIEVASVDMDFSYADAFGESAAPAYETLLLDIMIGEATLFTRSDEVEAAWRVIDPLIKYWEANRPKDLETYPAGSSGPDSAVELAARDGVKWRPL
jgi:glucose-6-phosphate 1-dehydrogenase